jgi:hypothetical protein
MKQCLGRVNRLVSLLRVVSDVNQYPGWCGNFWGEAPRQSREIRRVLGIIHQRLIAFVRAVVSGLSMISDDSWFRCD